MNSLNPNAGEMIQGAVRGMNPFDTDVALTDDLTVSLSPEERAEQEHREKLMAAGIIDLTPVKVTPYAPNHVDTDDDFIAFHTKGINLL